MSAIYGALASSAALAGSAIYDFNAAPPPDLNFVGNAEYRATGGKDNTGYISLFDAKNGQHASVLIPDFDHGLVVKAFTFEVDLRIGNATGQGGRPADGFSISFARASDPVVLDLAQEPPVDNINNFAVPGGPENGTSTGLAICFDTWAGNTLPGGIADLEGMEIIVDDVVQIIDGKPGIPMPTRNGSLTDATSLQTGPYNGLDDGAVEGLGWAHLRAELNAAGQVSVVWKGTVIATNLQTTFAPSAGRIVFAGRTGGANENTHIDNLSIVTIPSDKVVIGGSKGVPDGFSISLSDSGASTFDGTVAANITTFKLNGTAITATTKTKKDSVSTLSFSDTAHPIAPGSTNTVVLIVKDSKGVSIGATNTFIGVQYLTLNPSWAATGVDKTKPGFTLRAVQVDHTTDVNGSVSIAQAERLLHGDLGDNTADLTLYTGAGKTYAEANVINYNAASGNAGDYVDDGTVANGSAAPNFPGLPGTAARESGNDDIAVEVLTYIDFPKAGGYKIIVNSDDGFRTTFSANPREVLNSTILGQFDAGRGAADSTLLLFVTTPGIYPVRTLWFQGGGGANFELSAVNTDGVAALVNDSTTPGALKAYRVNNGTEPAAVSFIDPPVGSGRSVTPAAPIVVEITDGAAAVGAIKFNINGTDATPIVTKSGKVSKAVYTPSPLLPVNSKITLIVSFPDGTTTYSGTTTFNTTGGVAVPASVALKAADVDKTKAGFLIKTWQVNITESGAGHNGPGNSTQVGEIFAHKQWGWPNVADVAAFTGPGGSFVETGVLNYNGSSGNAGSFLDDGTSGGTAPNMPGINGNAALPDAGIDDYALEIRTVLDLQPGTYEMGVNSDDGFRLIVGDGKEAYTFPMVAGEFNGGRGADQWGFTRFSVVIKTAGLYPFRMIFEEGGGGNNVEWFTIKKPWLPGDLSKVLINDTANGGVKAYQYPINSTGPTYVKSFSPARSSNGTDASRGRAGSDATVGAVLVDGSTPVDTATVSLKVNGAAVTATVTKAGTDTTVSYKPAAGFAQGSKNTVDLTFGDRTVSWAFTVGLPTTPTYWIEAADFDYDGGKTIPAASAMPYVGGAYAGLGAAATDIKSAGVANNPYYRSPNTLLVPMSNANDFDRGSGEVTVDFRLGWIGGGQFYNYTRTIPNGKYNVYAALSHGDAVTTATRVGGQLAFIGSGITNVLGVFDAPTTGGWGNNALVPLKDVAGSAGKVLDVTLGGTQTLRFSPSNGDWDFLLLAPAATTSSAGKITSVGIATNGKLHIEYTGTLQSSAALGTAFTPVAGATSPYEVAPADAARFYRSVP